MPKVSVIIPAYNRAHCIQRAIQSVQSQTYKDLEIIVINDGSTDNTGEIVKSIPDDRIRYICCETNRGAGAARNEGMKAAEGSYIAFLDSDDEWLPEKIEKQIALMESLPEDWSICLTGGYITKNECANGVFRPDPNLNGNVFRLYALGRIPFLTPTIIIRRICTDRAGLFDERLWRGQDCEFFLRILKLYKLAVIPEALVIVHLETTKLNSPTFVSQVESSRLAILQKHEAEIRGELGLYATRYFRGNTFLIISEAKFRGGAFVGGLKYFIRAVVTFPLMSPRRYARILAIALWQTRLVQRLGAFSMRFRRC